MQVEIKVPPMGESITEATVGTLLKEDGAVVQMDEEIVELETDKVNQVLYAPQSGKLHISVSVDDVVKIGDAIGYVETDGAQVPTKAKEKVEKPASEPAPAPEVSSGGVKRITKESFVADRQTQEVPKAPASIAAPAPAPISEERETRKKLPRIRQVIARRLVEAQQTAAMLTTFNECDMSAVMALRAKYKESFIEKHGTKLGFMGFFVKAVVSALKAIPHLNASIDGDDLVQRHYYDVGIAVGSEKGLVVPVVRNSDQLSLADIEENIAFFAKKVREGTISIDDLQGGSFTITNGGIYGSLLSTPILNPPQSGILGMHKIQKRPCVVNDEIVIRPMMYLALSYDHRIVDGKDAVTFLVHVKECIEDPSRLLLSL